MHYKFAALAGHAATRTRRRHYNGGASGWEQHAVPEPDAERVGWNGAPRRRTDSVLQKPIRRSLSSKGLRSFELPRRATPASLPIGERIPTGFASV